MKSCISTRRAAHTPLVLIAALAFVLQHGLNSLRIILNNTFEQKVIFDVRSDLYSHIQRLPAAMRMASGMPD